MILLRNIILLRKSQLVTSYTLKHDVNRCFWNPAWSKCRHVYKPVVSFIKKKQKKKKRVCQYVNTTDLIVYGALYCNLTIVMIRQYLKSDKYWSIVWIFAMAANFSYFVQLKKIVISMLNCYCREHLILFMLFVALASRLVPNTLLSL